jgi:hypothetical protein
MDYTGLGLYPESIEETCPESSRKYRRGNGKTFAEPFEMRDEELWIHIKENMPTDRKIRVIELGSGRGSFTRFLALKLMELDKLDYIIATNISDNENVFNKKKSLEMGIPDDKYKV